MFSFSHKSPNVERLYLMPGAISKLKLIQTRPQERNKKAQNGLDKRFAFM